MIPRSIASCVAVFLATFAGPVGAETLHVVLDGTVVGDYTFGPVAEVAWSEPVPGHSRGDGEQRTTVRRLRDGLFEVTMIRTGSAEYGVRGIVSADGLQRSFDHGRGYVVINP